MRKWPWQFFYKRLTTRRFHKKVTTALFCMRIVTIWYRNLTIAINLVTNLATNLVTNLVTKLVTKSYGQVYTKFDGQVTISKLMVKFLYQISNNLTWISISSAGSYLTALVHLHRRLISNTLSLHMVLDQFSNNWLEFQLPALAHILNFKTLMHLFISSAGSYLKVLNSKIDSAPYARIM